MIRVRKAGEPGHFDDGWLDTYHTFSFGDCDNPAHMGVRSLRVINEDRVQPGDGVAVADESAISVQAVVPSDVQFFDLA